MRRSFSFLDISACLLSGTVFSRSSSTRSGSSHSESDKIRRWGTAMSVKRRSAIDQAASGAKLVGGLFILAGGLPMLIAMMDGRSWILQVAGTAATIMLVGPGVWYVMAAIFLKRKQYWTISTTYRVAMAQIVAVVGVIIVFALFAHWRSASAGVVVVPAILAVYFVPALIALLFD